MTINEKLEKIFALMAELDVEFFARGNLGVEDTDTGNFHGVFRDPAGQMIHYYPPQEKWVLTSDF